MDENIKNEYLKFMNEILEKSSNYEREYKFGSNKKIRDTGLKKLRNEISLFEYFVEKKPELYNLITCENSTDYHKYIIWDEFLTVQYFVRDLKESIIKLTNLNKE